MRKYYIAMGIAVMLILPAAAQDAALVFAALDANKDGKVNSSEAQRNVLVSQNFAAADKDHDGFLSKDEFISAFGKK